MKKLLLAMSAVMLSVLLLFCGCGNKEENKKENETVTQTNETEQKTDEKTDENTEAAANESKTVYDEPIVTDDVELGDYAGKFITRYLESGTYYIKQRTEKDGKEEIIELAVSGSKYSVRTAESNQIVDGDTMYFVMYDQKAVLTSPVADAMKVNMMLSLGIKNAQEAEEGFLSSGKEEVKGTEYSFEEYKNGTKKIKYYFDENTVRYIKHIDENGNVELYEILEISKEIPDDMFAVPDGFVIQDLSKMN